MAKWVPSLDEKELDAIYSISLNYTSITLDNYNINSIAYLLTAKVWRPLWGFT